MAEINKKTVLYIGENQILKMYQGENLIYAYSNEQTLDAFNISSLRAMKNLTFEDTNTINNQE